MEEKKESSLSDKDKNLIKQAVLMNRYEALGRYVEAKEKLDLLKSERDITITQLEKAFIGLKHINNFGFETQSDIQSATQYIETLLERYKALNNDITALVTESNQYAELCDKPQIEIK